MKTNRLLLFLVVILSISCCLASKAQADEESDRAALRLIRTNYMEAIGSEDLSKLAPNLSKDVTGVMVTGEEVKGLDGLQAYWKKTKDLIGPGGTYGVTVNTDQTDLYGDVAVSRGTTEDVVRLGNGKELRFNSFWTAVCRKESGAWKVVRMEAAMNPVDNVFVSARLLEAKLIYGIGGLGAGTVIALVVQALVRRRRSSI